jgi:hypothetical protein
MASEPSRAESSGTRIGEPEDWGSMPICSGSMGYRPSMSRTTRGGSIKTSRPAARKMQKARRKASGGQTSQCEFRAHLYTHKRQMSMAQVALRRLLGTRLGGIPEKTLAAGLGPGKEIDVDISAASRSPSPPVSSQRRRCLITGQTFTLTANGQWQAKSGFPDQGAKFPDDLIEFPARPQKIPCYDAQGIRDITR